MIRTRGPLLEGGRDIGLRTLGRSERPPPRSCRRMRMRLTHAKRAGGALSEAEAPADGSLYHALDPRSAKGYSVLQCQGLPEGETSSGGPGARPVGRGSMLSMTQLVGDEAPRAATASRSKKGWLRRAESPAAVLLFVFA